jgi:purine-binding chemotaxis protein CheW
MKKETRALLKVRAIAMAIEPEYKPEASNVLEVITFTLAAENYAIESVFIKEVYPLKDFASLPGVPPYILGVINVRGQILPVVDLKKFFNLPERGLGELNKVIILRDDQMEFGILADIVHGTSSVPINTIQMSPLNISGIGSEYLKGVTNEHLIILDAKKILEDEKIIVNQETT